MHPVWVFSLTTLAAAQHGETKPTSLEIESHIVVPELACVRPTSPTNRPRLEMMAGAWKGAMELELLVSKFAFKEGAKELPGLLEGHGSRMCLGRI